MEVKGIISFANKILNGIQNQYLYELINRTSQTPIGFCGLLQSINKEIACIYFLYPQYRGNGYAIEALKQIFEHFFINLKFNQIEAYIPSNNKQAWKVAERSGMMYIGEMLYQDIPHKIMRFKINKSDFEKQIHY